jgi:ATP-dependent RNA helicase DDX21
VFTPPAAALILKAFRVESSPCRQVTTKFLKPDHKVVDNVGESKMKANAAIKHMVLPCHWSQNNAMIEDLVRCYGGGKTGRTIVFVERKVMADEIASAIGESTNARALHGDVPQVPP